MKYIIANWKSHKNHQEAQAWIQAVKKTGVVEQISDMIQVVLCPSFPHLSLLKDALPGLVLGAQTLSPYPDGAYTGAVSARIAADFVKFAILGHVERRTHFGETPQVVAQQAIQALENGITPIIAVEKANWSTQLSQLDADQLKKTIVMYEPAEAISSNGNGQATDLTEVKDAAQTIRSEYSVRGVLYGGSVNATNVTTYFADPDIDGVVPGAASLDPTAFIELLRAAQLAVKQ